MPLKFMLVLIVPLALSACGTTHEKTVVVTPSAGSTVVVTPSGDTHVTPNP
jgi:hypothetical protein